MHLTAVDLFYWTAGFLGHLILLMVLWLRRRVREFPIFTSWVASNLARTITLAAIARFGGKATYYYSYWSLAVIDASLQFGIVYEMYFLTFRPLGVWAKDVRKAFVWLLAFSLIAALSLAQTAKPQTRFWVQSVTLWGNLFSSAWMSELFVGMAALCVKVGIPWRTHVARISQGLGVYSLFGILIGAANVYFGLDREVRTYALLAHFRMTVYLLCLLYWVLMLWNNAPDPKEMSVELHQQLAQIQARAERDLETVKTWRQR